MSVCTFGLYQVYWFYRNWHYVKHREHSRISPPWRSVLGVFFCYPLLHRIAATARENGVAAPPAIIAVAWIVTGLMSYLPEPYLLLSFGAVVFLVPVQRAANAINAGLAPAHDRNVGFSGWNIAALVFGGSLFALSAIGVLIGSQQR
ncbi:hypothetical protein IP90_03191 [Luteimonas cucumeris]|uniref:Uncharacterized protein n=2 Tax=Luteimonas cucumeris TaxID=985012 RepID=A0A562KUU5_9GAMM|nr:hypothetical protein IP90_03191 [Luteimonas cucumeris]